MKLLLIPFPQISSYFNQGGKFNEILAFLKKVHYSQWSRLPKQKGPGIHLSILWEKESASFVSVFTLMQAPEDRTEPHRRKGAAWRRRHVPYSDPVEIS